MSRVMRVVVLGHRGVVGSAVSRHLRTLGIDVVGVDTTNYASLRGPADMVINAAGSSEKRIASADPLASFRGNVDATLASVLDFPCGLYVYVSSITVYEDLRDPTRSSEATPIDPLRIDRYGFFKILGELVIRRHAQRWLVLRLGNIVGPGLRRNPIHDLLTGSKLFIHPMSTMAFLDTRAFARILWDLRTEAGEIVNVAGRGSVRLADVAARSGIPLDQEVDALPVETQRVNIDKLSARMTLPDSTETVMSFIDEWRSGEVRLGDP